MFSFGFCEFRSLEECAAVLWGLGCEDLEDGIFDSGENEFVIIYRRKAIHCEMSRRHRVCQNGGLKTRWQGNFDSNV